MNLFHQHGLRVLQRIFFEFGLSSKVSFLERRSVTAYHAATRQYKCETWKQHNSVFGSNIHTSLTVVSTIRHFSHDSGTQLTDEDIKLSIEDISEKFSEAMELMNDVRSSVGTVYFSEDMEDTRAQVAETLKDYSDLLARLNDMQKKRVIQSVGLKMEELKAQMSMLEELAKE